MYFCPSYFWPGRKLRSVILSYCIFSLAGNCVSYLCLSVCVFPAGNCVPYFCHSVFLFRTEIAPRMFFLFRVCFPGRKLRSVLMSSCISDQAGNCFPYLCHSVDMFSAEIAFRIFVVSISFPVGNRVMYFCRSVFLSRLEIALRIFVVSYICLRPEIDSVCLSFCISYPTVNSFRISVISYFCSGRKLPGPARNCVPYLYRFVFQFRLQIAVVFMSFRISFRVGNCVSCFCLCVFMSWLETAFRIYVVPHFFLLPEIAFSISVVPYFWPGMKLYPAILPFRISDAAANCVPYFCRSVFLFRPDNTFVFLLFARIASRIFVFRIFAPVGNCDAYVCFRISIRFGNYVAYSLSFLYFCPGWKLRLVIFCFYISVPAGNCVLYFCHSVSRSRPEIVYRMSLCSSVPAEMAYCICVILYFYLNRKMSFVFLSFRNVGPAGNFVYVIMLFHIISRPEIAFREFVFPYSCPGRKLYFVFFSCRMFPGRKLRCVFLTIRICLSAGNCVQYFCRSVILIWPISALRISVVPYFCLGRKLRSVLILCSVCLSCHIYFLTGNCVPYFCRSVIVSRREIAFRVFVFLYFVPGGYTKS